MTNPTPTPNTDAQLTESPETLPSPLKCLSGALISGGFAIALYFLTSSIANTFASKPLPSSNQTAIQISIAIRTLIVGLSTLATTLFTLVGVGLIAVTIYISVQQLKNRTSPPSKV
ncbi:MAG TPA: DUF3082 domain-containing protein [Stenomitos sp.]